MTTATLSWDGTPLGPGPIALTVPPPAPGDDPTTMVMHAASAASTAVVSVPQGRLKAFFEGHPDRLFVSVEVAPIHRTLREVLEHVRGGKSGQAAVWALTRDGRWVDLRLLDRQVRYACDGNDFRLRSWEEITSDRLSAPRQADQNPADADRNRGRADDLVQILNVFERLCTEAGRLLGEAGPPPRPAYEFEPFSPEEAAALEARQNAVFARFLERRQPSGREATSGAGTRGQAVPPDDPQPPTAVVAEPALLGNHVEVWAAVSLGGTQTSGLTVDPRCLPALLQRAAQEYRRASNLLVDKPAEVHGCFKWEGEEVAHPESYPVTHAGRLARWLRDAYRHLCDSQNRPPDIPRKAGGQPVPNPERWSFWAACDDGLWAWRQLFRMLEVARIAGREGAVRPHYETVPLLRSMEPNLAVYRSLNVPVFRPRDGRVFVAGWLPELRARCLAAVCVERGYVPASRARLYRYVLRQDDPLAVAASELYAGACVPPAERHLADAEDSFSDLHDTDAERYRDWVWLTYALLETAPLGLPGALLTQLLRNDFGLEGLTEHAVRRLQGILADQVAYELEPFLADATFDLVTARLDLTANEGLRRLMNVEHPHTAGAALRNAFELRRRRQPVIRLAAQRGNEAAAGRAPSGPPREPRALFEYRALTLGGRMTARAASAAVRRQEVLMAEEEVMLAVAHDLGAAGYSLLGLGGTEFLLEVEAAEADRRQFEEIARVVQEAGRRILGNLVGLVALEAAEAW
jgi:hypothetical protein